MATTSTKTTTSTPAKAGSLQMNIGGQTIIATPNAGTTAAQAAAAQAAGWTSYSGAAPAAGSPSVSGGQSLAPLLNQTVPTTIPLTTLKETPVPVTLPTKTTPVNYNSLLTPVVEQPTPTTATNIETTPNKEDTMSLSFLDYINEKKGLTPPKTEPIFNRTRDEVALVEKQQRVNNITGQINAIVAKAQADQLSLTGQGRGIPEAIIGGQQAQISKEAAIQTLPLQAQLSAAQGDLQMAQQHLDTLFKIRSQDAQNEYEYKNKLIDAVYTFADKKEQRLFDEKKIQDERAYQDRKASIAYVDNWSKIALANERSDIVGSLNALDPKSPTYSTDARNIVAKSKMVDLEDTLRKVQIAEKLADIEKTNAEAKLISGQSGGKSDDLSAYANQYADTGVLPDPSKLKQSGLTVGQVTALAKQSKKPDGSLVSSTTGVKSSSISPAQEDGIIALSEIVTQTLPSLQSKYPKLWNGFIGGAVGSLYTSQDRQDYQTFRQEFLNKLLKARSGATVTPQEYDRYAALLPGEFSVNPFTESQGNKKLTSIASALKTTLDNTLNAQNLSIYGYSKVNVGNTARTVGEIIDVGGTRYRVLPDGSLTDII